MILLIKTIPVLTYIIIIYNCAKYLKNLPLQSVSSRGNLQVVGLPPEDSLWMKQTVVVSF